MLPFVKTFPLISVHWKSSRQTITARCSLLRAEAIIWLQTIHVNWQTILFMYAITITPLRQP